MIFLRGRSTAGYEPCKTGYGGTDEIFHRWFAQKTNQRFEVIGITDVVQGTTIWRAVLRLRFIFRIVPLWTWTGSPLVPSQTG